MPANRPRSRTPTSTAKITASAAAMVSRGERLGAGRALGLDLDVDAGALGGGLERLGGHVGVGDAGRAGGHGHQDASSAALRRGRRRDAACRGAPQARLPGGRTAPARGDLGPTRATILGDGRRSSAARSASVNAGFTRARASLVSSWRWVASPPAGAAIRKARSAGPSLAPKSTGGESRAKARVGARRRRCGSAGSRCRRGGPVPRSPRGRARPRRAGRRRSPDPASSTTPRQGADHVVLVGARGRRRGAPGLR